MGLDAKCVDCELGFEIGAVLLQSVAVDAKVIAFEEADVPGSFGFASHGFRSV